MKPEAHSINDILAKNATSFFIPPFQRSYAWGKDEIERYFSDIIRIIDSELDKNQTDKLEHFFGTIVIKNKTDVFDTKSIIIDGQQRLTTTLLFLIALRDLDGDSKNKRRITNSYLTNSDSTFPDKIKLKQVTKDWDSYRALVKGDAENAKGQIGIAYNIFKELISKKKKERPEIKFENYISALNKLNVVEIDLDNRPYKGEDPQIIFETLNSLGKALTLSDLIRNYILIDQDSDDQTYIYEQKWYPMIEEKLGEDSSDFFRDFLQCKTSESIKIANDNNAKEIYQQFRDFVKGRYKSNREFVDEIIHYAPLYECIIYEEKNKSLSKDKERDKIIKELLRNIFHDIKSESFKPLVLALLFEHSKNPAFSDDALIENLQVIRTYLIRRRVLRLTQGENKNIPLICKEIDQIVENKGFLIKRLANMFYKMRLPNDDEIESFLSTANFYEDLKNYCKFILGKIEENNTKVAVDFRDKKITVEHLMPQTLTPAWEKELGENCSEIHKNYLHNIGNLILTEFNSEIGNNSFDDKKKKLQNSSLNFRLEIIKRQKWDEESIKRHREKMICDFLNTFPLPDEMRHSSNYNQSKIQDEDPEISPLTVDPSDLCGSKPLAMKIDEKEFKAKSWQEVYLNFMRFIKESRIYDFQILFENQKRFFAREDAIVYWKGLKKTDDTDLKKYKTIDGKFSAEIEGLDDDTLFLHTNFSAESCITRIANIMKNFGMDDESVKIRIKP